jgi:hypothetical protein
MGSYTEMNTALAGATPARLPHRPANPHAALYLVTIKAQQATVEESDEMMQTQRSMRWQRAYVGG